MDQYQFAIEEMALSGEVGLGECSKSTVYRWAREINNRLAFQKATWRVAPDIPGRALKAIGLPCDAPSCRQTGIHR